MLGFLQECNLVGTVSVFPCKLCLINLFLFQRCNFFRRTENFKNKLQIEIAFLVAYLFTEYYMCIYLNEGSINGAWWYQRGFFCPSKVEIRDKEIERLTLALDGGRSHEVLSLESRSKSNEKLISHLNLQVINLL